MTKRVILVCASLCISVAGPDRGALAAILDDVELMSVRAIDWREEPEFARHAPRLVLKIEFSTATNLVQSAAAQGYNVRVTAVPCGETDMSTNYAYSYVFSAGQRVEEMHQLGLSFDIKTNKFYYYFIAPVYSPGSPNLGHPLKGYDHRRASVSLCFIVRGTAGPYFQYRSQTVTVPAETLKEAIEAAPDVPAEWPRN